MHFANLHYNKEKFDGVAKSGTDEG